MSSYHHQKREQPTRAQEGQKPNKLYRFEKQEWERSPFWLLMQSEWTPVTFHLRLTPCQDSKAKARNPCPGLGAQQRPHDYFKGKTSDSYGWVTKNAGSKGSKPGHESPLDQWLLAVWPSAGLVSPCFSLFIWKNITTLSPTEITSWGIRNKTWHINTYPWAKTMIIIWAAVASQPTPLPLLSHVSLSCLIFSGPRDTNVTSLLFPFCYISIFIQWKKHTFSFLLSVQICEIFFHFADVCMAHGRGLI